MRGSSFSTVLDSFAAFVEGIDAFDVNVLNEFAASVMATQHVVGAAPADLTAIGSSSFADLDASVISSALLAASN